MAIQFLKNSELKGSTFRSRLINVSGRDISGDVFSLIVKNNFDTIIKTIVPTIQGNAVLFQLTELESLPAYTYTLEYWGDFSGLGKEIIAYETFTITETPFELQTNKNINITSSISIEDIVINLSISNPIIQVIGEDDGIGNKEYKISLSDLDVTGWEDPTFDDKVVEYIQTLNITVTNNEVPYFVVEEKPNFRLQADWESVGVTEENFIQIAPILLSQTFTDTYENPGNITSITNFKIENNILSCTIEGDYNSFKMVPVPGHSVDLSELVCDVENIMIGNNPKHLFPITAFKPEYPFKKLKTLILMAQITEWVDTDWISHIPNNGNALLIGIESAAGSPVANALLAKGWTIEFEFIK